MNYIWVHAGDNVYHIDIDKDCKRESLFERGKGYHGMLSIVKKRSA